MEAMTFPARYWKRAVWIACVGGGLGVALFAVSASAQSVEWFSQFGTSTFEEAMDVAADATGTYVVGRTNGSLPDGQPNTGGGFNGFLRKYDAGVVRNAQGVIPASWTRQFGGGIDEAHGVAADGAGFVYVVGLSNFELPGSQGRDAFVRKYDSSGNEIWTRLVGTPSPDQALAVAVNAGSVYIAGSTLGRLPEQLPNVGRLDGFVSKFTADGNHVWTRQFGSSGDDQPLSVAANDTHVYVAGTARGLLPGVFPHRAALDRQPDRHPSDGHCGRSCRGRRVFWHYPEFRGFESDQCADSRQHANRAEHPGHACDRRKAEQYKSRSQSAPKPSRRGLHLLPDGMARTLPAVFGGTSTPFHRLCSTRSTRFSKSTCFHCMPSSSPSRSPVRPTQTKSA